MKSIILSFDYELFFGDKSGTVENSLIIPTYKLLECMESVGFRGVFFIDWLMLKYLKEIGDERTDSDYNLIVTQLKEIVRRGHRIELHIHPHWIDARYNGDGTWNFDDFTHYSLQSLKEDDVIQLFIEGRNILTSIAREVDENYKIVAFRAGGWAIQPFEKIKKGLKGVNVLIDASVAHGQKSHNSYSYYDFNDSPLDSFYRIEDDVCKKSNSGRIMEIPISVFKCNVIYKIIEKIYQRTSIFNSLTDGTHIRASERDVNENRRDLHQVLSAPFRMMTFSKLSPLSVFLATLFHQNKIVCFIDHPKDYTSATLKGIRIIRNISRSVTYSDVYSY